MGFPPEAGANTCTPNRAHYSSELHAAACMHMERTCIDSDACSSRELDASGQMHANRTQGRQYLEQAIQGPVLGSRSSASRQRIQSKCKSSIVHTHRVNHYWLCIICTLRRIATQLTVHSSFVIPSMNHRVSECKA